ncbi:TerC family protein [Imperialibacter roseus]|uniref:TerC family protein n=1 Tax=Imperialibacter roseus TaxID=1324217 RepID=A0ABZ0IP90_9BACT|nr:TerC family protein [Imperialibacter roseus]WOK06838.1 TerC family protein [Imperialibacter roseus]|tara:strand:+ start:6133 stop:6873 length:741 start_codon:yes stop_codon:yes gene_type:complete
MSFDIFLQPSSWIALLTLTFLEIVLGIDNILFISIVSKGLPDLQQKRARTVGLSLALVMRIGLLFGINYITRLTNPLFSIFGTDLSGRDLVLMAGGMFLVFKSVMEVHQKMEGDDSEKASKSATLLNVIVQIVLLDMIFSFDSILTAVGLTEHLLLMIIAVVISMGVMMVFAGSISNFIHNHPTLEVLALSFLILIGFMLFIEGWHHHVPKGYIYFAVFFALVVEVINMRMRKARNPVKLKRRMEE